MSTYTYSLASDFGGSLRLDQLHNEIVATPGIINTLTGVNVSDDVVDIIFESSLSGAILTILNTLISNHVPDYSPKRTSFYAISSDLKNAKSSDYALMKSFNYGGSDVIGVIDYIEVVAKAQTNSTYDLRVVNQDTNDVLCEVTGNSNTKYETLDMGTISNVPSGVAILELQARSSANNKRVYVQELFIYHGNTV